MARKKGTCFVIMPYGQRQVGDVTVDFDLVYEQIYRKAGLKAGFKVERSDTRDAAGSITSDMLNQIFKADVALVDITMANANVFYELGVRHALSRFGTVLVRMTGGDFGVKGRRFRRPSLQPGPLPFDVKDVTCLDIAPTAATLDQAINDLAQRLELAVAQEQTDSAVFHHIKGLRVQRNALAAPLNHGRTYEVVAAPGRLVGFRSGDVQRFVGSHAVGYWVSSENNIMEMARVNEHSMSSMIRFLGAEQPDSNRADFQDTIYDALTKAMGNRAMVEPGEVLVTGSGRLAASHDVKAIFHASTVYGKPGEGFFPYEDSILAACARTVLTKARAMAMGPDESARAHSLVLPLFGTGQARQDPVQIASLLASTITETMKEFGPVAGDAPDLREAYLIAYSEDQVDLLRRVFSAIEKDGEVRSVPRPSSDVP